MGLRNCQYITLSYANKIPALTTCPRLEPLRENNLKGVDACQIIKVIITVNVTDINP